MLTLDAATNRIWVTNTLRVRTPGQLVVPGGIGGMDCRGIRIDRYDALLDAMIEARAHSCPTVIDVAVDPAASHVPASND